MLAAERFGSEHAALATGAAADFSCFGESGARHLVVGGRLLVRDGALVTGDVEPLRADAREHAARLWKRMAQW